MRAPIFGESRLLHKHMNEMFPLEQFPAHMQPAVNRLRRSALRRRVISFAAKSIFNTLFLGFLGLVLSFAVDRSPPIRSTVRIATPRVKVGHELEMRVVPFRIKLCAAKVAFVIFDGQDRRTTIETPWQQPAGPLGLDKEFMRPLIIPSDARPGMARLRVEREFKCPLNPFHEFWPIVEVTPDMPFEILEGDPK